MVTIKGKKKCMSFFSALCCNIQRLHNNTETQTQYNSNAINATFWNNIFQYNSTTNTVQSVTLVSPKLNIVTFLKVVYVAWLL